MGTGARLIKLAAALAHVFSGTHTSTKPPVLFSSDHSTTYLHPAGSSPDPRGSRVERESLALDIPMNARASEAGTSPSRA